jgi:phospholipase C
VIAANATGVTVTGTDGSSYTLSATGGTQAVSPKATTTYTATATGAGGKASAATTVTVTPAAAPTVSITANPTSITAGGSSTLTVAATNASQVTVTGTDGSSYTLTATGGTQAVSPTVTTTYTATATGAGGKASAGTTVTVVPAPTVSITAKPTSIVTGSSSTLTVMATNATGVTIAGTDGSTYTLQPTGGTQAVNPTVTTTYTATAIGADGGKASATATVTVTAPPAATVSITAAPATIFSGSSSTLTVVATNATAVTVTGTDGSSYPLAATGGTQVVSPTTTTTAATITYTATATGAGASATATATVTVNPSATVQSVNHVIFMLQENHTFDDYFGMLNPYRIANSTNGQPWNVGDDGNTYTIDGIDDKLNTSNPEDSGTGIKLFKFTSTCIDDDSSAWLSSFGDVNRFDFATNRPIQENGFVHTAEGFATSCNTLGGCSGNFTDVDGQRAMGYYDQGFLNYYYYMASQFAVSNRWFSPVASKSVDNRIATFTGGTTQGLVDDPGLNDHLPQLAIPTIFNKLQAANVTWRIYYTVTQGYCLADSDDCGTSANDKYPATDFSDLTYSYNFLYENPNHAACTGTTQPSSVVGDASNSFCIDPNHIAPITQYYTDLTNGTLPSFAFIEAGYAVNDEHPGSGQSVLAGQQEMSYVLNAFMNSSSWSDSVFFFSYDEGGGPYDHVPPVPGHSNDFTDSSLGTIPDISTIAVNPDTYFPCVPPGGVATTHCDLQSDWPGASPTDAPAVQGFASQLGFRLPNMVISPFTRRHYVSNIPMDHTAVIRFVEDRFIGNHQYLTGRDAVQPTLLDFFDFNNVPWATPPIPPAPVTAITLGYDPCTPTAMGP